MSDAPTNAGNHVSSNHRLIGLLHVSSCFCVMWWNGINHTIHIKYYSDFLGCNEIRSKCKSIKVEFIYKKTLVWHGLYDLSDRYLIN